MNILFAISEAYPFAKTGGLGDVGGSLPAALNEQCLDVRVIMPRYSSIPMELQEQIEHVTTFKVELSWRKLKCNLSKLVSNNVCYYFIENEYYFSRDTFYGFDDDGERFAFFSKAVLESLTKIKDFQPDIIHCNDWHTALIPLLIKENYGNNPFYFGIKTVFTIHNLKHQGVFPAKVFEDVLGLEGHVAAWDKLEFYGGINYMKAALLSADYLTTVSQTYAHEILHPYFGEQLDGVLRLRSDHLCGILNGLDIKKYNPQDDPNLLVNYRSSLCKKEENKKHLQELVSLPVRTDIPVLAMISRLVDQKGLDLVAHILEEMLSMDLQMVVLGTGDKGYEEMFKHFASKYPYKIAVRTVFDEALSHKIYGGSDILLMPSRFEPCGLSQMIAMRYGTIPIVRETGGLKDSVYPYNDYTGEGNGFTFANYNAHELLFAVQRAVKLFFEDKAAWKGLAENARKRDFSWGKSAKKYAELYHEITVQKKPTCAKESTDVSIEGIS